MALPMRNMKQDSRTFWLPTANYYVLAVGLSAALFFVLWGVLKDTGDETPWITAGISASLFLCGFVVFRQLMFRRSRTAFIKQQPIKGVHKSLGSPKKLTLERNAAVLNEIKKKSDAANLLNSFSAGH